MNIYVGNLAYSVTEDELQGRFAEYGDVTSVKIITDRFTGNSKGFGFVEMETDDAGEAAISALNDQEIAGRRIKVNKARPRNDSFGGDRRGGGGGGRW